MMRHLLNRAGASKWNTERNGEQLSKLVVLVDTGAEVSQTLCNDRRVLALDTMNGHDTRETDRILAIP